METIITDIMNSYGYLGIFFLIMIENVFPPIPSELILTFGGFMVISSNMTIVGVIIAATLGSVVGALILYFIGKILNKERLIKIVTSKYGKLLRVKPKDIESADKWFNTKGNITVLFCRFVPIVRSLISIPAGMSEMPMFKFLLYTTIGSAVWNTALVCVGAFAGDKKDAILAFIDNASHIILIVLIILIIGFIIWFYHRKSKKAKSRS
ncbi:MAG TPA: DedA family protein [Candidatus Onthousia faecavium]|nr:DedA family protein [Candidatus Onthousia faecavium]